MSYTEESWDERVGPALTKVLEGMDELRAALDARIRSPGYNAAHKRECHATRSVIGEMEIYLRTTWQREL